VTGAHPGRMATPEAGRTGRLGRTRAPAYGPAMPTPPPVGRNSGLDPRLGQSDDVFGASARLPDEAASADPIEIWGRRIGRSLAVLAAVAIILWFLRSYL
jgi:hypothetical protein